MRTYVLTVRLPFEAIDAMEARETARQMMQDLQLSDVEKKVVKLQEVFKGKPPEKVEL